MITPMASSTAIVHDTWSIQWSSRKTNSRIAATTTTTAALMASHDRAERDAGRRRRSAMKQPTARRATATHKIADGNLWPNDPSESGPENQPGILPLLSGVGESWVPLP